MILKRSSSYRRGSSMSSSDHGSLCAPRRRPGLPFRAWRRGRSPPARSSRSTVRPPAAGSVQVDPDPDRGRAGRRPGRPAGPQQRHLPDDRRQADHRSDLPHEAHRHVAAKSASASPASTRRRSTRSRSPRPTRSPRIDDRRAVISEHRAGLALPTTAVNQAFANTRAKIDAENRAADSAANEIAIRVAAALARGT